MSQPAPTSLSEYVARQPRLDQRRKVLRPIMNALLPLGIRMEASGQENIAASGPTLLMMNHISYIDPLVCTAAVSHRNVISMAKVETLDNWFSRFMLRSWGNFVVKRGEVDREALNNAIGLLKSGQLVLIAPEGTRHPDGLQEARDGIVYLAHKADAVIVPTAVVGAVDWASRLKRLKRAYARVIFGQAFRFSVQGRLTRVQRHVMMREAMYQLALTIPDEYAHLRGEYGDIEQATTSAIEFVQDKSVQVGQLSPLAG